MPDQISPHIEQFYGDQEIISIIEHSDNLRRQFNEPDIRDSLLCVVLPVVRRGTGYQVNQLDLDVFVRHGNVTELGQYELYRVKDFIRQQVDIAPVLHAVHLIAGVDVKTVADSIKRQVQFLQKGENRDLPVTPAQMINR